MGGAAAAEDGADGLPPHLSLSSAAAGGAPSPPPPHSGGGEGAAAASSSSSSVAGAGAQPHNIQQRPRGGSAGHALLLAALTDSGGIIGAVRFAKGPESSGGLASFAARSGNRS